MKLNQKGISIVELLIVIFMTGLLSSIIVSYLISYWRYGYFLQAQQDTMQTRLTAGDILRDSIGTSKGMIMQNSIPDTYPGVADTTDPTGTHWAVIHAVPGNYSVGASGTITPLAYYRRPSISKAESYIMNGTQPYEDEYVLYLNGTTKKLMLRTLVNPGATGDKEFTSCPPANATATCPADKTVAANVSSIDMRYFSRTGNLIDYTSITDPNTGLYMGPDFTAVEVVEFKLNLSENTVLQKDNNVNASTIIRVALRNA